MNDTPETAAAAKVPRKEIAAWALYDFANSSFPTVIITGVYVLYFKAVVVPDGAARGDFLWGLAISIAMLFVAISSPILGAAADYSGAKKKFLVAYASTCIVFTAALYCVGPGQVFLGILFFVIANIGFAGGNVFYNAFLPEISDRENMGRISGLGWSVGYIGGMLCLIIVLPLAKNLTKDAAGAHMARWAFPATALFFLFAALPTFLWLKERARPKPLPPGRGYLAMGFAQFVSTLREVRRFKELATFLLIFLVYNDGVTTVVAFTSSFASQTLRFSTSEIVYLLIGVNLAAAPGAYLFGLLADRIGSKRTIMITLVMWTVVAFAGAAVQAKWQFWVVSILAGTAIGAVQSVSRTLVGLFSPASRSGEFFGFQAVCGKFAAVLGPLLFGVVSSGTGSQRIAVAMVGGIFAVSFFALWRFVDEHAGIAAAQEPTETASA